MSVFGDANLNVVQQINTSKGELAYNVIDLELPRTADGKVDVGEFGTGDFDKLQVRYAASVDLLSRRVDGVWGRAGRGRSFFEFGPVRDNETASPRRPRSWRCRA